MTIIITIIKVVFLIIIDSESDFARITAFYFAKYC